MNLHTILTCLLLATPVISMAIPEPNEPAQNPLFCGAFEPNAAAKAEEAKIRQAIRNRVIWGLDSPNEPANKGIAHLVEKMILKSNYAQRFAFLPDSSPFKQACSKINGKKEVDDACAVLSNFLYCAQHPDNPELPAECHEFCKEFGSIEFGYPLFKQTLLALQKELHLDPKEVIDFIRAFTKEAESRESSELCSNDNNISKKLNTSTQEEEEVLFC
ncbi:hypothetical protein BH09DEP1_BH09DEP1_8020 [soil metagenome]